MSELGDTPDRSHVANLDAIKERLRRHGGVTNVDAYSMIKEIEQLRARELVVPSPQPADACDHDVQIVYPGSAADAGGFYCRKCDERRDGGRMARYVDGSMWWESLDWDGNVFARSWRGGPFGTRPAAVSPLPETER